MNNRNFLIFPLIQRYREIPRLLTVPELLRIRMLQIAFVAILLQACHSPGQDADSKMIGSGSQYARGFSIETLSGYKILHVKDPWQGSSGIHLKYVLASNHAEVPDSLNSLPMILTPVSRVICMSTTHVAMLEALGKTECIVGVSGPDYISNPKLRARIDRGETLDVGADQALNYERIISLQPDVIISYGVTAEISGMVKRLGELGIPVILNGDYLENEPLGKTEWLKFMAAFFEMDREADSIFEGISREYEKYKDLAIRAVAPRTGRSVSFSTDHSSDYSPASSTDRLTARPAVLTGLPWKDAWYLPGGKSFAAAFIRDAGADYLWADMDSHEASPVNLESVFARALEADFWINSGNALSLEDIRKTEARLAKLGPFQQGQVFNNTTRLNPTGGNDFWETGVMEPQLILADLIRIFHPDVLPEHKLKYYQQLQ